ncbi:major facilitator superfamily domain-containing protein [Mycena pura]|uniref:Major facilitator superfamily domain-containing protein n=1 Tax=Mycena pura TaxID=153505 RepID=A0AAD6Y3B7_9AGAR|nr:major facilitator superfamily domain-containing protein [Mycena pura]
MHSALPDRQSFNESSPLLTDHVSQLEAQRHSKKPSPLPKAQLAALCISKITDPVAYTQIFPYINEFLLQLHVTDDVSKVGFYSGVVESTFAITQSLTSYYWASLSDAVGRRPIILTGAAGLAVVTFLLGFCTSFTQIIFVRAVAGFLAGNLAVGHAILAEITDESNQAIAYPLYACTWPLGAVVGPLIGGQLSNLGTKYPEYFGFDFILSHPYFMPNLVCALLVLLGLLLAYLFLEETLSSKRLGGPTKIVQHQSSQPPSLSAMELLSIPMIRALTASGFALGFVATAFDVVFVKEIGYALALNGCILTIFLLFLMPFLLRTYNPALLYNTSMRMWPITFICIPFLNLIVRSRYDKSTGRVDTSTSVILWICIALVLVCSRTAALAYSMNMILVRNHSPSPSSLGAANGLVQVAMGGSRCFSPAFVSSVFALSVDNDLLGGYPVWAAVMLLICLLGCYLSQKMVAMDNRERMVVGFGSEQVPF